MASTIKSGWLKGHYIRRARKLHTCDYWWGNGSMHPTGQSKTCRNPIRAGELYVEGEPNDTAGGFGHDRYCLQCAILTEDNNEISEAIAKAKGE